MLRILLSLAVILFTACATPQGKIIFRPDPAQDVPQEQTGLSISWQIIESQNGPGETGLPAWVRSYLDGGLREIETLDAYNGKFVFVGKSRGENFNALQQWANGFSAAQDLPRLIVQRVEKRLVASAALYPDDEYGEYFANMIKKVSDGEYPGANKEYVFWIKQKRIPGNEEDADSETPADLALPVVSERYEFLILLSIDKEKLQTKILEIMADIKTNVAPTREQTAAINKIRHTFFEGF